MAKLYAAHQQRVIEEYKELNERLIKLTEFIYGNKSDFFEAPEAERNRLTQQYRIMCEYSRILQERIAAF